MPVLKVKDQRLGPSWRLMLSGCPEVAVIPFAEEIIPMMLDSSSQKGIMSAASGKPTNS